MRVSATLTFYIGRVFLYWIGATMGALCTVVFLFDLIELLRRSAGKDAATFTRMLELAFLKLPAMAEILLPFAVLFGGMLAFSRLTRSHELVVTRAAGVSVWQILLPALVLAVLIGALRPVMINPISAALSDRYESLEAEFLKRRTKMMSIANNGLWVRERSHE
ncbi:MAG: LptF/LptG family permease, partial [Thalassobaculaceae bacterium]